MSVRGRHTSSIQDERNENETEKSLGFDGMLSMDCSLLDNIELDRIAERTVQSNGATSRIKSKVQEDLLNATTLSVSAANFSSILGTPSPSRRNKQASDLISSSPLLRKKSQRCYRLSTAQKHEGVSEEVQAEAKRKFDNDEDQEWSHLLSLPSLPTTPIKMKIQEEVSPNRNFPVSVKEVPDHGEKIQNESETGSEERKYLKSILKSPVSELNDSVIFKTPEQDSRRKFHRSLSRSPRNIDGNSSANSKRMKSPISSADYKSQNIPQKTVKFQEPTDLESSFPQLEESFLEVADRRRKKSSETSICQYNCPEDIQRQLMLDLDETFPAIPRQVDVNLKEKGKSFYGLPDVVKKLIKKVKGIEKLYEWQEECLNLKAIEERTNLIYALPTSGGKTLVAEILILREIVRNHKNAIFILPFVAIVQEKVRSLAPFALELGFLVEEYAAGKGSYPPKKRQRKNSIYICTIEKALSLVNSLIELKRLDEIGIIVVDELHLLGESSGRGATLEGLLTKVMFTNENVHIVGMSATIGNLNEVAQFLNAELYTENFRPVEIKEYVKCGDNIWSIDVREEEIFVDKKKASYRYSKEASLIDPDKIGGLVMDIAPKDSCLIFCSSRKNCENVALLLTKVLFRNLEEHKKQEKELLMKALQVEGALCPILAKTIKFGVAYHHSGLTTDERLLLESAFNDGTLCVICCTSTLAAGVNLPARRVILRNPYVGKDFINLSRYKQMIGRAGRAGFGEVGESILICNQNDMQKVREVLVSKMDESLSSMHIEEDRGINNLILSAILLTIATTRAELHKLVAKTLLSVQQDRFGIKVGDITDTTISNLVKSGVLKIKGQSTADLNLDESVVNTDSTDKISPKKVRKILLEADTVLEICELGRAAMKGSITLQMAQALYEDLKAAQKHLILIDHLHLLYLVTPYEANSQINPVGTVYYNVVLNLLPHQMQVARLLGINETVVSKLRNGSIPKNVEKRVVQRFYKTLMLHELWNQKSIFAVSEKYQVNRGATQQLVNSVSSFSSSIIRFCEELSEFWPFRDLFTTFSKKLSYFCTAELESLMELPGVKIGRAYQLHKGGFKNLQSIANASPEELQKCLKYLSKKSVSQLIASANLLLLEKVENLRDEAVEVLGGINFNSLEFGI